MKQKLLFMISAACLMSITACNNNDKEASSAEGDSTALQQPAAENNTANMDATVVAPDHYKLLGDTAGLRIIEINYKPGESSQLHSHPEQAVYVIEGGTVEMTDANGKKDTMQFQPGMAGLFPGATHSARNIGTTNLKALLVEVNRPNQTGSSGDASMDATRVAAKEYKTLADTLGVRIIAITYNPGEKSNMHAHPDAAFYALTDANAEFTAKDGSKRVNEIKGGTGMFTPADTHSVKNVGTKTMKGILVEVTRPVQ